MNLLRWSLTFAIICLVSTTGGAQELTRSASIEDDEAKYGHRWALLVGINYEDSPAVRILQNAENDVRRVQDALQNNFGFQCEMLLGATATKEKILAALTSYRDKVGPNDCFLLYFAGHGSGGGFGYIFPSDIQTRDGEPDIDDGILCTDVVARVSRFAARHSLIVLDSCFSGRLGSDVHEVERPESAPESDELLPAAFRERALQAITSAADDQKAADGQRNSANSPFATVLLDAFRELGKRRQGVFTARELASYITLKFQKDGQQPQFFEAGAPGEHGQFHFIVEKPFELLRTQTAVMQLASGSPGTFWFDEMPWLTPAARLLLDSNRSFHAGDPSADATWLDTSLDQTYQDLRREVGSLTQRELDEPIAQQLNKLLTLRGPRDERDPLAPDPESTMKDLLDGLNTTATRSGGTDSPTTLHLKALVLHRMNAPEAHEAYAVAAEAYGREHPALRARALADHAQWLSSRRDYPQADLKLRDARTAYKAAGTPAPLFEIELLSSLAMTQRKQQDWEAADTMYARAIEIADEHQLDAAHPVRAFLAERIAWSRMDEWRIEAASEQFEVARDLWGRVRDSSSGSTAFQAFLKQMHAEHGLAMASRLRGKCAVDRYREIQRQLQQELEGQRSREDQESLYVRLVNTTERLSDCYLLEGRRGMAAAIDNYRYALRYLPELPPQTASSLAEQLCCKMIIAATVSGATNDFHAAVSYLDDLDRQAKKAPDDVRSDPGIYRELADAFRKVNSRETYQDGLDEVRRIIRTHAEDRLSRDVEELLLLAAEVVSEQQRRQDARILQRLIPADVNGEAADYFRDRYDRVIDMKASLISNSREFEELVELIQKVKKPGIRYLRVETRQPFVVFHFSRSKRFTHVLVRGKTSNDWDILTLNLGVGDFADGISAEQSAKIDEFLAAYELPPGTQVCWNDDRQIDVQAAYPLSMPQEPNLIEK